MLAESQIKRLLRHCENIEHEYEQITKMSNESKIERSRNVGWIQALRLTLQSDTYPIRKGDDEKRVRAKLI